MKKGKFRPQLVLLDDDIPDKSSSDLVTQKPV